MITPAIWTGARLWLSASQRRGVAVTGAQKNQATRQPRAGCVSARGTIEKGSTDQPQIGHAQHIRGGQSVQGRNDAVQGRLSRRLGDVILLDRSHLDAGITLRLVAQRKRILRQKHRIAIQIAGNIATLDRQELLHIRRLLR